MGFNIRSHPYTVLLGPIADTAGQCTCGFFRFPAQGKVLAVYAVNDAAIAAATNTLQVVIGSRGTTGTTGFTTIANFAATAWTARVPRTGALTAANQRITTSATWLAYKHVEAGTGGETRMVVQVDYMVGAYEDSA